MKVLGLSGKQVEVKGSLARFDLWSSEMEREKSVRDQGIFCVKPDNEDNSLVLFAWIQDTLLDSEHI